MKKDKITVGWVETVQFSDWGIDGVDAKVDTGARSSALHVDDIKMLPNQRVGFTVVLCRNDKTKRIRVTAPLLKIARVRSSTGKYSKRCFVKTHVRIGPVEKEIEISLVSREKMIYRMLIGRRALEHDFIVDVSRRHIATPKPKRKREPR